MTTRRILFHVADRLGNILAVHEGSPMHKAFQRAGPAAPGVFIAGNPYVRVNAPSTLSDAEQRAAEYVEPDPCPPRGIPIAAGSRHAGDESAADVDPLGDAADLSRAGDVLRRRRPARGTQPTPIIRKYPA
jgi:hypothetical protein